VLDALADGELLEGAPGHAPAPGPGF